MTLRRLSLLATVLLLAGCARPADPYAMVPASAEVGHSHKQSVLVSVTGGSETNRLWVSKVASPDFQEALRTSLQKFQVFSDAVKSGGADLHLEVALVELKQPIGRLDITVTAKTSWNLTDPRTHRVVWQDEITTPYTSSLGDVFTFDNRLAEANEGAIRGNIKAGVEKIGNLSF